MIPIKDWHELAAMRVAGRKLAEVAERVRAVVQVGVSTDEVDRLTEEAIRGLGARPAFKGYKVGKAVFPKTICISINEQVVHGIPGKRLLREGDIVTLDFGLVDASGYYADLAFSVPMPGASARAKKLLDDTEQSLYEGVRLARPGGRIGDIGCAIQGYVEPRGYGVVTQVVGHGIGRNLHEEPSVPNFGKAWTGYLLKPGMVLAIEPMITLGKGKTRILEDKWTVVTEDGSLAAHFEHTVAITPSGPEILTTLNEGGSIR
jgi:methionyl aminopeptidase